MNTLSRHAFASLLLLFALSAFIQLRHSDRARASLTQINCTKVEQAAGCDSRIITGSTRKTVHTPDRPLQFWMEI